MTKSIWSRISTIGVNDSLPAEEEKSIVFVNRICAVVLALAFLSVVINLLLSSWLFIPALSSVIVFLSLCYVFHARQWFLISRITLMIVLTGLILYMTLNGGYGSGLEYYFFSLMALPIFLFRKKAFIYLFQLLCVAGLVSQKFCAEVPEEMTSSLPHQVFYVFNSCGSALMIVLAMIFFRNLTSKNEQELEEKNFIIENKNSQLQQVNQQLDSFSHSVAHDLKSPLRTLEGYSGMLEEDYGDRLGEEGKGILDRMKKSTSKMRSLIENLLLFSRSSKKELKLVKVDMEQLAKEILAGFEAEIQTNRVRVSVASLPPVMADKDLIYQVLFNLISNALKFSRKKEKPVVEIGFRHQKEMQVYFVKDNGTGFDSKYAGKLFEPFQRLHSEQEFEGSGIGLSIVRNIILRHEGKIWAESEEGKGAVFYFSLPVR